MGCLNAWYEGSVSRGSLYCKFHPMVAPWWPFAPKWCHVINLPSLQSMRLSNWKPWLRHTSFLGCTSVVHQSCTLVSVSPFLVVIVSLLHLFSVSALHCWSSPPAPLWLTVTPCLPSWKENAALEESFHVLLPYHPFLTAPDLALVFKGKTFSYLASMLQHTHCKALCL